jgi:hypothetical protein
MSCGDVNAKKMLQNEDDKIRNAIDRLGMIQPSIGTKISSWWQGVSRVFSSSASRAALQINTVIDRAFTPDSTSPELVGPVQLKMDDKRLVQQSGVSPLARQESFIEPFTSAPTCDCHCSVPECTSEVPECTSEVPEPESVPVEVVATDAATDALGGCESDSTFAFTKTNEDGDVSVASEAEKKEV